MSDDLTRYLDADGKLKVYPSKPGRRLPVLHFLAEGFDHGKIYSEREVNALLDERHSFHDPMLLRRDLVVAGLLNRTKDGAFYWLNESPAEEFRFSTMLFEKYGLRVHGFSALSAGNGGDNYFVYTDKGCFLFKRSFRNAMNLPENEAVVLAHLRADGLPVSSIYHTLDGNSFFFHEDRNCYLQTFLPGSSLKRNDTNKPIALKSASLLGRLQRSMTNLPKLPEGIGKNFFLSMTKDAAEASLNHSLEKVRLLQDDMLVRIIAERVSMLKDLPATPQIERSQCGNTHGDFTVEQLLAKGDTITGVVDFCTACVHPYVWELFRSFLLAGPETLNGEIPLVYLNQYIERYLVEFSLPSYDLEHMSELYLYQSLVCDYFAQALNAGPPHRDNLLHAAMLNHTHCKTLLSKNMAL